MGMFNESSDIGESPEKTRRKSAKFGGEENSNLITMDFEELDNLGVGELYEASMVTEKNLPEFLENKLKTLSNDSVLKKMSTGELSETASENMSFNAFSSAVDLKDIKLNNLDFQETTGFSLTSVRDQVR